MDKIVVGSVKRDATPARKKKFEDIKKRTVQFDITGAGDPVDFLLDSILQSVVVPPGTDGVDHDMTGTDSVLSIETGTVSYAGGEMTLGATSSAKSQAIGNLPDYMIDPTGAFDMQMVIESATGGVTADKIGINYTFKDYNGMGVWFRPSDGVIEYEAWIDGGNTAITPVFPLTIGISSPDGVLMEVWYQNFGGEKVTIISGSNGYAPASPASNTDTEGIYEFGVETLAAATGVVSSITVTADSFWKWTAVDTHEDVASPADPVAAVAAAVTALDGYSVNKTFGNIVEIYKEKGTPLTITPRW